MYTSSKYLFPVVIIDMVLSIFYLRVLIFLGFFFPRSLNSFKGQHPYVINNSARRIIDRRHMNRSSHCYYSQRDCIISYEDSKQSKQMRAGANNETPLHPRALRIHHLTIHWYCIISYIFHKVFRFRTGFLQKSGRIASQGNGGLALLQFLLFDKVNTFHAIRND